MARKAASPRSTDISPALPFSAPPFGTGETPAVRIEPATNWTPEQRAGITTVGRSLLVSAAAGSGKTSVLAERCAHLVCDADEPSDVDALLVVTYTRDAAAEMRTRIEKALRVRADRDDSPRLARQLSIIDRAQISTIHGFCSAVLRQHFHLLGIDPGFKVLDESEGVLLRNEVARDVFGRRYENDTDGSFTKFIDDYADGNDELLVQRVVRTHELLCSVIDPVGWMSRARERLKEACDGTLRKSELGAELAALVTRRLDSLRRRCIDLARSIDAIDGLHLYAEHVAEMIAMVETWRGLFASSGFDALAAELSDVKFPRLPTIRNAPAEKERAQKSINKLKDEMKSGAVADLCRFSEAEWHDGMRRVCPSAALLLDLIDDYGREYRQRKQELRSLDFSDLEREALRVLRDSTCTGSDLRPSDVARAYHRRFAHVLVDEFQDVNEVQEAILHLVSRECVASEAQPANLFCVGDVKQSIYRFRLAEPQRFLERYDRFRKGDPIGQVIDLQTNFRSRGALLALLNGLFQRLMCRQTGGIDYDAVQRLNPPKDSPYEKHPAHGPLIELHLLPKPAPGAVETAEDDEEQELDRTEREAAFVAHRIRQLMGAGGPPLQVLSKGPDGQPAPRPLKFGDVAILLRAVKFKSGQFADMLRKAGIPVVSDSGAGFFETTEIRDMLALLQVLDNRQQDIPLAAVLRSPLVGLADPEDCLARIRLAYPERNAASIPFHQAVVRYAREQDDELAASLRDFVASLDGWREKAIQRPLSDLIWQVYFDTGYLAYCSGLADGEQRVANLVSLHERARQFGSFQRQGLSRFLQFLESLHDETDLGTPNIASVADDAVRVMSIHKSKGLEFPVVFLADLGKAHNQLDSAGRIVVDRNAGIGLEVVDQQRRIVYPSLASIIVKEKLQRHTLMEELRVLYVATTRAREKLILVGTETPEALEAWRSSWTGWSGPIPADEVLRGRTFLDWLVPAAVAMNGAGQPLIPITQHDEAELKEWRRPHRAAPSTADALQRLAGLHPLGSKPLKHPAADELIDRLSRRYAHEPFVSLQAAQSVTDLTKHGRTAPAGRDAGADISFARVLAAPRFVTEVRTPTATEIGDVTHRVLEHLDFRRPCDRPDLRAQIDAMATNRIVAPALAAAVDVDAIAWLLSTDLGALLREHSGALRRELPIFFPLPPDGTGAAPASANPDDQVMVRGRLDVLIPLPTGPVLVDYKTDSVTPQTLDARAEFYRPQVESYRDAVAKLLGRPVAATHLVFLTVRQIRTV